MAREDTGLAKELGNYWDLVVHNQGRMNMNVESNESQMIDEMHALWNEEPPLGARERVRQQVTGQEGEIIAARNGLIWQPQSEPASWPLSPADARTWIPFSSATRKLLAAAAAVLLLILGAGVLAYNNFGGGDGSTTQVPAAFPVALASPSPDTTVLPVELIWTSEGSTELPFAAPADIELGRDGNIYVQDQGTDSIHVLDPDGNQLAAFGEPGTGDGQFLHTVAYGIYGGLAFDSAGNLYVADSGNHRVQKFDQDHQFLLAWGSEGEGDDQFDEVSAIAIDAVDNVYVLEGGGKGTMKVFDGEGSFLRKFELRTAGGGLLRTARELAVDEQGRIWAVDTEQNRILIYSVEGEYLGNVTIESSPLGLNYPSDMDFDSHGRGFIAEYVASRVQVLDDAGEFLTSWGGVGSGDLILIVPEGIAVDDEGSVYVIDQNRVLKFQLKPEFWPEE